MIGTRNARLILRTLFASIVALSGLVLAAPPAEADPCSPLDLGCVVDDTTTTAGGVVDDTSTTVGVVVDDTTTTVGGVAGSGVPIDTGTPLDEVVPAGPLPVVNALPGAATTPPSGGATPPSGGATPPSGGTTHIGTASSGSSAKHGAVIAQARSGRIVRVATGGTTTIVGRPFPTVVDAGDGGLSSARLARTLAFPLALILLVIGFVLVQNRIDRRDPKLALAPVGSDSLTFS